MITPPFSLAGATLSYWAFAFILVLTRTSAMVMVMPGLGEQSLPMILRAGIALILTTLTLPLVTPTLPPLNPDTIDALHIAALIANELFAGLLIGWLARLVTMALPIAGQMIALSIGISSVLQPDPDLGSGSSAPARFLNLLAPLMLLMTGAYLLPIKALIGSYTLLPFNALFAPHTTLVTDSVQSIILMTSHTFALALQLSAPFLILSLIWQMMLGLMTRLLPALQIYNTASPLQLLGGIALLGLSLQAILSVWQGQAFDALRTLPGL